MAKDKEKKDQRVDFTKKYPGLFEADEEETNIVDAPEFTYLVVNGKGHGKGNEDFEEAMKMLYGLAFAMKLKFKREQPDGFYDYKMPYMESVRWDTDKKKKNWRWKAMLMQPDYITEERVKHAMDIAKTRHPDEKLPRVKHEKIHEGLAIQTLHVGSYQKEHKTIKFLREDAHKQGYEIDGKHHEIYLNDRRRTREERLQTIVRYPVKEEK